MEHHYFTPAAKVNWLTLDKFGNMTSEQLLIGAFSINWEQEAPEVRAFRDALQCLEPENLHSLFCERLAYHERQRGSERDAVEAGLFFNAPAAFADYGLWARQLVWSLEQCIALSLGRRPEVLNYYALLEAGEPATTSDLGQEFFARQVIGQNWIKAGQLAEEATPGEYLAWLRRTKLSCAPELVEAVEALGHQVADWRSISEGLTAEVAELDAQVADLVANDQRWEAAYNDLRSERDAEVDALNERLERAELALKLVEQEPEGSFGSEPEALDPRERKSLHKLIFAMAKAKYWFDPEANQWPAVSKIMSDMALAGLPLSDKRVRFHLGAAAATAKDESGK